jgi:branched-chain amino acid transport system ATP-binding protein
MTHLNATPAVPLLEVEGLTCRFGGLTALDRVSLSIHAGEIFGLIGPNGAGKTTLFNALSGVTPASEGQLRLAGRRLEGLEPHGINRLGIARTFQNLRLFESLSVGENVEVGLQQRLRHRQEGADWGARRRQVAELLELVELADVTARPAGTLSYGERRRLEIARALATGPRLLLLDEPAAGMNPAEKHDLTDLIRRLRERFALTILLIEHHVPLVMGLCDRIAVLNFGRRIALGVPDAVRSDPRVIEAYLGGTP